MKELQPTPEPIGHMWPKYYSGAVAERVMRVPTADTRSSSTGANYVAAVESDRPKLVGLEQIITREISTRLRESEQVVYVEPGIGMGLSPIIISQQFPEEIKQKRLRIIGTNVEPAFTIQGAIMDTKRRLQMCGSFEHWIQMYTKALADHGYQYAETIKQTMKPPVYDWKTLKYIEDHHQAIEYFAGIDITQLPALLAKQGVSDADIIHEHFGGIYHAKDHQAAVHAVCDSLKPQGILWTHELLNNHTDKYGDFRQYPLHAHGNHSWADGQYKMYSKI